MTFRRLSPAEMSRGETPQVAANPTSRGDEPRVTGPPATGRATEAEKRECVRRLRAFQARHATQTEPALERLREQVRRGGNLFDVLMETVRVASLGQITAVLYEMGGRYRRSV